MSQVIGNIISNSYKYADTDIDISYAFNGNFLEMSIRDHGEGVDPEETGFLTNKYYRGKKNSPGKEGSGLGLYISAELMKKMNGQLICISDRKGFEVRLKIPLA
jgi:signal transduction histidine kinase